MTRSRIGIAYSGFLLGGAQVLLVRQSLALAGGDEVVFSLALGLWLLTVATGSALGSVLVEKIRDQARAFSAGLTILSLSVPAALILLPYAASRTNWIPGIVPGAGSLVPALSLAILPLGLIGGALFPVACRLLSSFSSYPVNHAYLLEAAGSFLAGTGLSLIFAPHLSTLTLACCLALPGFGMGLILLLPRRILLIIFGSLIILALSLHFVGSLETMLISRLRPGMEILETLQTPYGLLEATRRSGQITVYENGLLLAISDDPSTAEERADLCLVQYPDPRRVLWIGGSLGGALPEALHYTSLQRLDLVEINPALISVSRWFNRDLEALRDSRVSFHLDDGRRFLDHANASTYDLIALNLPGPRTARLAKFYTVEFFRLARRALKPGGVLVFTMESSEDFIGSDLALLLASLRRTLQEAFPQVIVLPGGNAIFVAGESTSRLASDWQIMTSRLDQAGIQPLYWDQYRLRDRFSDARIKGLSETLAAVKNVTINRDVAPVSFYFNQVVWAKQSRGGFAGLLKAARGWFKPVGLIFLIAVIAGAAFVRNRSRKHGRKIGAAWAVETVGMTGISLEILALIGYQVRFGSGYRELGLLLGLYMAGLAVGARVAISLAGRARRYFPIVQTHWILAAGSLIPLMTWGAWLGLSSLLYRLIFALYLSALGLLGGVHFPLALEFGGSTSDRGAGRFYALDLAGAAFGALVIGLIALPLGGMTVCAVALALLNAAVLVLLIKPVFPSPP